MKTDYEMLQENKIIQKNKLITSTHVWIKTIFDVFLDKLPTNREEDLKRLQKNNFSNEFTSIIDNPFDTMKHDIISFNVQKNVDKILEIAKEPPGTRSKPHIGILRVEKREY
jgi:hypothetical protein